VADGPHGERVDLTRNFRSLGALCDWCNDAFAEVFAEPELADVQADYVPFEADRPPGEDAFALRRIDLENVFGNRADDIAEQDAARIADAIRAACDGAFPDGGEGAVFGGGAAAYSDFLILTRTKQRLSRYTDALAARGIPFDVTGSDDLGTSPELRALVELLRCALRPDDPVAATAYLRGGVCGFSDADLYAFKQAGGGFDAMTTPLAPGVLDALPDDLAERFDTAFCRIRDARDRLTTTRPALAIETLARDAGLVAGAVHPEAPEEASLRGGQMLRALTYVRHWAEQGMRWGEITAELRRVVEGEEDRDSMTLETGQGEAVRVMNAHQAKGLEAPVVFLADPYSSGSGPKPKTHVRREQGEAVIPVVEGEYQTVTHAPLAWHDESERAFQAEEMRREEAEEKRLLYVAATRAENMLVVSTYAPKEGGGCWGALHAALARADVPALPAAETASGDARPSAPAPDLEAALAERDRRVHQRSTPSYAMTTVTGEEAGEPVDGALSVDGGGHGNAFGKAVHALFERLVRERAASLDEGPVRGLLEPHLDPLTDEHVVRARRMADRLLDSALWREVQSAERVFAEYPVADVSDPARPDASDDNDPLTEAQRGVIDLLYEKRGGAGWRIVEFKTDRVADGSGAAEVLDDAHPYRRQVQRYADAWAQIAGAPPVEQGLWLADAGEYVPVTRRATS
jgi:ATP-dependent helicase/nuclease subunit A